MPRARPPHPRFDHGQPIHRPQTLPILFFLVALVGGLVAFNGRSVHALTVDLPTPYPGEYDGPLSPPVNRLSIDPDHTIRWNAQAVSEAELKANLIAVRNAPPWQGLIFDPDGNTDVAYSLRVLEIVREAGLTRDSFCFGSTARYRDIRTDDRTPAPHKWPAIECVPQPPLPFMPTTRG